MKKLLIATAALAMVAGTAQAQSSVTVYGIVDAGYSSVKETAANGTKTEYTGYQTRNGGNNLNGIGEAASSRLGFRGTEDLGGGLKANFVLESGMSQNTAFTFGNRAYWAGIESKDMGEVRIGRQDSLIRSVWLGHDQLAAANVVGNLAHSDPAATGPTASHTNRFVGLNYLSPRFNGVQVVGSMMQSDTKTTTTSKNGTGYQAGANYVAGKFSAAAAYADFTQNAVTATGAFNNAEGSAACTALPCAVDAASAAVTSLGIPAVADQGKVKETGAAASYDFGVAKVAYIYNKRDIAVTSATSQRTSHAVSASAPLTAKLVARLGYGKGEVGASTAGATKYDIEGYQAALNYNLSKRTMVYGIYGDESRNDTATTKLKVKEYSVGVRHSF
jgi:predicted porin